ncbi:MAG: DegV family protein [Dehalococcoidia bacterium]|nr:DegV family protein [Dehalococcoidia bacterium]
MGVRIVTDSSSDLPASLATELGITVVPCNLHFGQETFRDSVDMDADVFYQRLSSESQLPTTSQPSPGAFLKVYRGLSEAGHQVVSIHVSNALSGTVNSALQAKEQLPGATVEVIDSRQVSLSLGLAVTAAARAATSGASFQETLQVARRALEQVRFYALLDTLEYLRRGGRVGKVKGFVGSLLRVRPLITAREGLVESVTSVRSRAAGIQYMVTLAEEAAPIQQLAVMHATTPDEAEELAKRLSPMIPGKSVIRARVGPVIGTHAGPGAIGIAIQSDKSQ